MLAPQVLRLERADELRRERRPLPAGVGEARVQTHRGSRSPDGARVTAIQDQQLAGGVGLRVDMGNFDVHTPLFCYARNNFPAVDFPFTQTYHKQFFALGPEGEFGLAWEFAPLQTTCFIRARLAAAFGTEHTWGLLTQSVLGSFHFDYQETSMMSLFDVKAGCTWRPQFAPGLQVSAGGVFEGGPSTYPSLAGDRFSASILEGIFIEAGYLF